MIIDLVQVVIGANELGWESCFCPLTPVKGPCGDGPRWGGGGGGGGLTHLLVNIKQSASYCLSGRVWLTMPRTCN